MEEEKEKLVKGGKKKNGILCVDKIWERKKSQLKVSKAYTKLPWKVSQKVSGYFEYLTNLDATLQSVSEGLTAHPRADTLMMLLSQ